MYIFWFLHQTTTNAHINAKTIALYIFWFLHQTTTLVDTTPYDRLLYIFWFLHQTTTGNFPEQNFGSCISFDSYIKPQPKSLTLSTVIVVYLLIPTSNHNSDLEVIESIKVVYLLIPTSNHNSLNLSIFRLLLYIFWFLHQTTTLSTLLLLILSCISFDSYIKPQQRLSCR